jgi:hypothetical protein
MPELRLATIRLIVLACCIVTLCSAQDKARPSITVTNDSHPDPGAISGNTYSNSFFDLTYEFPKDWIPHGEATKQRLMEIGKDKVVAAVPGSESALALAEKHTYNLLTVFENELGTPGVTFFRSEVLSAEDVSWAPGIRTGKDYLLDVLPLMKKQGYDRFSEIKEVQIGGRTFYRADLSKQEPTTRVYQAYLATIVRGHALSLIVSTEDPNETAKLAQNAALHFGPKLPGLEGQTLAADHTTTSDPRQTASVSSGLYHNKFFGMDYRLPEGWYVDTNAFEKLVKGSAGSDPAPSPSNLVTLLAANEVAPGSPGITFNPFLSIVAYNSSLHPETATCIGYLQNVTYLVTKRQHGGLIQQGATVNVGDHKFYRADYKQSYGGYETVLCTVWKQNDLSWTFVGRSPQQMDDLAQSIRSISFSSGSR